MSRNNPPPIRQWFRYRIFALFTIALYSIRFGIVYTPIVQRQVRVPKALDFITAILPGATDNWQPIWLLGFIWIALGFLALAAMVWDEMHNWAFILTAVFTFYWSAAYVLAQFSVESSPGMNDTFTAVFILVGGLLVTLLGLLTRPADTRPDPTPPRVYREGVIGEHRVADKGGGDAG